VRDVVGVTAWLRARWRTWRVRRRALASLRRRLARARARGPVDAAEAAAAARVADARRALSTLVGAGAACAHCAEGMPAPAGTFAGGACCAVAATDVFGDIDIDLLAATGKRPRDLRVASAGPLAGCALRGPTGCAVGLSVRPSVCQHYVCHDLMREQHARGVGARVGLLQQRLADALHAYDEHRQRRLREAEFDASFAALVRAAHAPLPHREPRAALTARGCTRS